MLYRSVSDLDDGVRAPAKMPRPSQVVLTTPAHFDVEYVINPHMTESVGTVDRAVARQQWISLRAVYTALDIPVRVVPGEPGLPDMVFCANQTLPFYDPDTERRGVVLSRMHAEQRAAEVPHFAEAFRDWGYEVASLPDAVEGAFEGMGDAIWHPGRALLWGGHGFRTAPSVYEALGALLDVPVVLLALQDPEYYHLDTCFCPLDAEHVLAAPAAFDDEGWALIQEGFDTVIEAPDGEARHQFACNAHCPDGTHVLIQEGCDQTAERLRAEGFRPVELDTSEFMKAGGSVFCLKQMIW